MNILSRIRLYHAILASLSLLAYVTGEVGIIHAWLGYGVSAVIVFRLLWALSGERQLGLMRFYPSFEGLKLNTALTHPSISKTLILGIGLSLIAVTATGIFMDKGHAIGMADTQIITTVYADNDEGGFDNREKDSFLGETHEFFANLLLMFVGMHAAYLLLFKRPLALFMLFVPNQTSRTGSHILNKTEKNDDSQPGNN